MRAKEAFPFGVLRKGVYDHCLLGCRAIFEAESNLDESSKLQLYTTLGLVFEDLGMRRKAAFFLRFAAEVCISLSLKSRVDFFLRFAAEVCVSRSLSLPPLYIHAHIYSAICRYITLSFALSAELNAALRVSTKQCMKCLQFQISLVSRK